MGDKSTRPLPAVELADLAGYAAQMREADRPGHRALWAALGRLVGIVAAMLRRLPPEA
jgi:hypothetical protein